jgi:hypothetical protein
MRVSSSAALMLTGQEQVPRSRLADAEGRA